MPLCWVEPVSSWSQLFSSRSLKSIPFHCPYHLCVHKTSFCYYMPHVLSPGLLFESLIIWLFCLTVAGLHSLVMGPGSQPGKHSDLGSWGYITVLSLQLPCLLFCFSFFASLSSLQSSLPFLPKMPLSSFAVLVPWCCQ